MGKYHSINIQNSYILIRSIVKIMCSYSILHNKKSFGYTIVIIVGGT